MPGGGASQYRVRNTQEPISIEQCLAAIQPCQDLFLHQTGTFCRAKYQFNHTCFVPAFLLPEMLRISAPFSRFWKSSRHIRWNPDKPPPVSDILRQPVSVLSPAGHLPDLQSSTMQVRQFSLPDKVTFIRPRFQIRYRTGNTLLRASVPCIKYPCHPTLPSDPFLLQCVLFSASVPVPHRFPGKPAAYSFGKNVFPTDKRASYSAPASSENSMKSRHSFFIHASSPAIRFTYFPYAVLHVSAGILHPPLLQVPLNG